MPGRILIGDNRKTLATLPACSVHAVVTSPPYYALRSYLPKDHPDKRLELGSEKTPDEYLANQVAVFREVKRVLRDDGLCFVNLGDSYVNMLRGDREDQSDGVGQKGSATPPVRHKVKWGKGGGTNFHWSMPAFGMELKPGDQMIMPHRFALAMVADGWWLRDTIIWHKPSPMPSSQNGWRWERCRVKLRSMTKDDPRYRSGSCETRSAQTAAVEHGTEWDECPGCPKCAPHDGWILRKGRFRTTTAHEYVFLFAKSKSYFGDAEQCKEEAAFAGSGRESKRRGDFDGKGSPEPGREPFRAIVETRLPRSVWRITAEPYKKSHFATFPTQLVRKCLSLAVNPKGCCPTCGSQYAPVVQTERVPTRPARESNTFGHDAAEFGNRDPERHIQKTNVLDYWPTCSCKAGPTVPCTVLDPYGGSGTTAQAAQALGHDWIICELNAAYVDQERIDTLPKWARRNGTAKAANGDRAMPLFANLEGTP